ncbi:MAG: hypothetical protein LBQ10_01835 [Desulfovibrio sp.]|jgi:hypothetical protein|nr:hypothetical protein [Desulfovibrio sp.]
MQYFPLRREYQVAYIIIGLIFLCVSAQFWIAWLALPADDSWTFLYFVRNATVTVLGILLVLRPWRSKLGLDGKYISYADGILPSRRIALAGIRSVYSNKGKRMILYLTTGRRIFVEHTFEGLDEFLVRIAESNIPVLDKPLKGAR